MKTLIIIYASYRYKKLTNKYNKMLIKETIKGYSHDLNVKRMKLFNKILKFKENWRGCIYEI